jgi:acyl-[acyl-carrier-protein]-phospholipid O-acyltransferase/long-chain-fatty-acid--[acyl-carrier-protein] ligase
MASTSLALFRTRRFLPLFVTQLLGALNDNVFKNALVILVTYRLADQTGMNGSLLATAAAGIFILPFFLLSATAGRCADKFEKSWLIALIKLSEIAFMGLAVIGFAWSSVPLLLVVLFLMGVHSTFFGPLKYGILPTHLHPDELIAGNAFIEAGTFLAILLGTVIGGVAVTASSGIVLISSATVAIAGLGFIASLFIPKAAPAAPELRLGFNIVAQTWEMTRYAAARRDLLLSVLGISWFWLVGATFLAQFPTFAKDVLGGDEHIVTLFLTVFSIGIGLGSLLCNRLLAGEVSARHVPFGALGITIFAVDLYYASRGSTPNAGALLGVGEFLMDAAHWRIVVDLLMIAVCGGVFIVPLYAILQTRSEESHRSRVIAANNIVNALFLVVASAATFAALSLGISVTEIFLAVAIANLVVAVYICGLLPDALIKAFLAAILRLAYRVDVRGIEHYKAAGDRAVIVVNHVSFLDPILLATFLPDRPMFAINTFIARQWWVRPFLPLVRAFPIDPTNPLAMKGLVRAVQGGAKCVIFPEGRITVTGALMKIYEGPGLIADRAGAPLVPIRIDGAQYTPFSRLRGKVRTRWFPKITVTILPPQQIAVSDGLVGRVRRQTIGRKLHDIMTDLIFTTCDHRQTLFATLADARTIHSGRAPILEDIARQPLTYRRLIAGSFAFGRRLAAGTVRGERVGVLLPNSNAAAITFFALQAVGRVPALLNFSTGSGGMLAAVEAAQLRTIVTSQRFLAAAKLEEAAQQLGKHARLLMIEDVRAAMGIFDRLYGFAGTLWPRALHRRLSRALPSDPAVVLFTSGSEGRPKGVVLSHQNILANRYQLGAVIDFNPTDTVFNALPIFHSFGLTGGLLLPLLSGIKTFLYPSPLHYRIVPELVYDTNATILFGTDTFLSGYARMANAYDFYSVRYIFAGAERVRSETRRVWAEKFGLRILEGYGATETAPAIATNTPMQFKAGTVGRFLPGLDYRLEPVPGITRGARLSVHGPNVMLGYLRVERPGVLEPPADGWYDTGDIVDIDADGFVTILGRAKRFAKIAGEMVPLGAVEDLVASQWPSAMHAVVAVPDARRGEALVLVTDREDADRQALLAQAQKNGLPELFVPKIILAMKRLPLLGSGKIDYVAVLAAAEQTVTVPAESPA